MQVSQLQHADGPGAGTQSPRLDVTQAELMGFPQGISQGGRAYTSAGETGSDEGMHPLMVARETTLEP